MMSWVTKASPVVSQTWFAFWIFRIVKYTLVWIPGWLTHGKDTFHNLHSGSLSTGLGLLVAKLFCGLYFDPRVEL